MWIYDGARQEHLPSDRAGKSKTAEVVFKAELRKHRPAYVKPTSMRIDRSRLLNFLESLLQLSFKTLANQYARE